MTDAEVELTIRQYLPQIIHMSLATCADGKPWVCEVHFAYDDDLNLYWVSEQTARHSREVAANPNVSGTIATQHHMNQLVRGVTFEGAVEVLQDVDTAHPAFKAYSARFPGRAQVVQDAYIERSETGRRIYKIHVKGWYLIDGYTSGKIEKLHLKRHG